MIDSNSYSNLQEVKQLCEAAAENGLKEKDALGQILNQAQPRDLNQWDSQVRSTWELGLEEIFSSLDIVKQVSPENSRLLKAMFDLGFDGHVFRDAYFALAKATFGQIYQNPVKLSEAMGFRNANVDMQTLHRRWEMMSLLQIGAWIYDATHGVGRITAVDKIIGDLTVEFASKRYMPLSHYLDKTMAVRQGTKLDGMLNQHEFPQYEDKQTFLADMRASVLTLDSDLPLEDTVKRIFVPALMSEEAYVQFSSGGQVAKTPEAANAQETVKSPDTTKKEVQEKDSSRWDNSRDLEELVNRLKVLKEIKVDNVNSENVTDILSKAAGREQQSELFAQAIAYIWHEPTYKDMLREFLKTTAGKVCLWNNSNLFLTVTDKLPGKLVAPWLDATNDVKGSEYLVEQTIKLPFRLWSNVEKLLPKDEQGENLLSERVYKDLEHGKANAEMLFWLWYPVYKVIHSDKNKKKVDDEKTDVKKEDEAKNDEETKKENIAKKKVFEAMMANEKRLKCLSDAYLLFKTLRVDVKGSYLKSQRELHRMLLDEDLFQNLLMRGGQKDSVQALVHCVKHQPLLDAWERQSLLVKIVRLHPEFIELVEEKTATTSRQFRVKLTSNRSYRRRQLELKHLIDVEIPENVAAIEYARSLGDLRENSEFKFAKEQQRLLSKRRGDLETMLDETRPTDFRNVKVEDVAIPGCAVDITFEDGRVEEYFLLGRFDTIPERNMISYETPLGQILTGTKAGSTLEMPSGETATLTAVKPLSEEMLTWLGATEIPEDELK
jgi:transcription elongation GreA/GreB family factor